MRKVISALGRPPARIAGILALAALFLSLLTLQQDELRRERERYHYLLTTNPPLALALLASAVEEMATLPSEFEGKLVEVPTFDEEGNPLYALTPHREAVYAALLPHD